MPIPPPERVVDAFLPDEDTAVVPHPRYPDDPSSRISYAPSEAAAPGGKVGSLFGLYPYSSTSFLLSSSASLRCFRFRQKNKPASTRRATATMGTTTATAIVPELERPELDVFLLPLANPGGTVDDVEADEVVEVGIWVGGC